MCSGTQIKKRTFKTHTLSVTFGTVTKTGKQWLPWKKSFIEPLESRGGRTGLGMKYHRLGVDRACR